MPATDRQKGVALARQREKGSAVASVTKAPPPKPARVAGTGSAQAKPSAPKPVAPKPAPPAATGRWRVQLGAYSSPQSAREQWTAASAKIAALKGLQPSYESDRKPPRLRYRPLAHTAPADAACP